MAEILVKSPVTTNGRDPKIDSEGKVQFKETILDASSKATLLKINEKLPQHLKKVITDIKDPELKTKKDESK